MSKNELENMRQIVLGVKLNFQELARIHNAVNFLEEASFAMQILSDNDYTASVARGNPDSLKRAILNVAIVGLSLNPFKGQAYLVPRKGRICLDISYQGYVDLHVGEGVVSHVVAELVYENDEFAWRSMHEMPVHKFNPFEKRGRLIGGYVVATLPNQSVIITHMSTDQINELRDRSEGWKSGKFSPWKSDYEEMAKKTMIRRARKSWPKRANSLRLAQAEEVMSDTDRLLPAPEEVSNPERIDLILKIRTGLEIAEKQEADYVNYLKRICRRNVNSLEDLTTNELKQCLIALNQMVDEKQKEEK